MVTWRYIRLFGLPGRTVASRREAAIGRASSTGDEQGVLRRLAKERARRRRRRRETTTMGSGVGGERDAEQSSGVSVD